MKNDKNAEALFCEMAEDISMKNKRMNCIKPVVQVVLASVRVIQCAIVWDPRNEPSMTIATLLMLSWFWSGPLTGSGLLPFSTVVETSIKSLWDLLTQKDRKYMGINHE